MSQFYNRYVPPKRSETNDHSRSDNPAVKRRRIDTVQENHDTAVKKKQLKREHKIETTHKEDSQTAQEETLPKHTNGVNDGHDVLNKYRVSQFAKSQNNKNEDPLVESRRHSKKPKKSTVSSDGLSLKSDNSEELNKSTFEIEAAKNDNKHSGVLRKYDKSKKRSITNGSSIEAQDVISDLDSEAQKSVLRDLIPIPQPEGVETEPKPVQYATIPTWQAAAIKAERSQTATFADLGLSEKVLSNLKERNISKAFPIQSTVIPLVMDNDSSYKGDICVSAATGSGKTLAYVIPIIESLRRSEGTGLRAVFVVPTRELVKQVRETCEMCASGSNLNIVTAMGSKSLQDEQKALVVEEKIHDPEGYKKELMTPIDWTAFNLEKILKRASRTDFRKLKDHVLKTRIKADILIATPGRLVDHLQETDGFHLNNVEWLVVDEADRLLNESYQDWIDVVVPALRSRTATEKRDEILAYMRMDLPPRIVRKILLSATMTKDISKLNHIGLVNPKLVVLEPPADLSIQGPNEEGNADTVDGTMENTGNFSLPALLREFAVVFKEGTEKPLLLIQLLRVHLGILTTSKLSSEAEMESESDLTSSDDSSDESSSTSDGTSESDSDIDSDETSSTSSNDSRGHQVKSQFILSRKQTSKQTSVPSARALVFTRSTASASRLSRLLSLLEPSLASCIGTLTRSTTSSSTSRKALSSFRKGKTLILIATDRASRGIDVEGLNHVISYDIPGSAMTYVHRVGRTARAGLEGSAWTLVEHREGRWFWNEIGGKSKECTISRSDKVKKMNLSIEDDDLRKRYDAALKVLGSEVRGD